MSTFVKFSQDLNDGIIEWASQDTRRALVLLLILKRIRVTDSQVLGLRKYEFLLPYDSLIDSNISIQNMRTIINDLIKKGIIEKRCINQQMKKVNVYRWIAPVLIDQLTAPQQHLNSSLTVPQQHLNSTLTAPQHVTREYIVERRKKKEEEPQTFKKSKSSSELMQEVEVRNQDLLTRQKEQLRKIREEYKDD